MFNVFQNRSAGRRRIVQEHVKPTRILFALMARKVLSGQMNDLSFFVRRHRMEHAAVVIRVARLDFDKDQRFPKDLWLAVNAKGVQIYQRGAVAPIQTYSYET